MAGNTAVISMAKFSADWATHIPISALCERYTVTKDQVLRLKVIWQLAPRHDRRLRAKPKWAPRPSREEDAASGESLELAPAIAKRIEEIRSTVAGGFGTPNEDGVIRFEVPVVSTWTPSRFQPASDENGSRDP
jgi:hypothetical protein